MSNFDEIAERIHQDFEQRTAARDRALTQARSLTRACAHAIRATHRNEDDLARQLLSEAGQLAGELRINLTDYPDLYYAGYTQDALKEYAEAQLVFALVHGMEPPRCIDLNLETATYLQGLAECAGELRRRCLDMLLHDNPQEAQRLMGLMDDIYAVLVTMDYPDAITGGLRRLTDVARSIIERTRGDLTLSLRQERLEHNLRQLEHRLEQSDQGA
jgi:translin